MNDNMFSKRYPNDTRTSLMDLPIEIRRIIYRAVLIHNAPIPIFHYRPAALSVVASDDLENSLLTSRKQGKRLQSSKNALAHTCRQAYRECSSIYYSQNVFRIFSGVYLRDFVNSHQPIHIQSIRTLAVRRLENATGLDLGMVLRNEEEPLALDYDETIHSGELLRHFHGLEELNMVADLTEARVVPNRPSRIAFLKGLVEVAQGLPSLRKIFLLTRNRQSMYPPQNSCDLDSDDVPGWVYSFLTSNYVADSVGVIETLERVHEPLWPPVDRRRKDRVGERIDNWLRTHRTLRK